MNASSCFLIRHALWLWFCAFAFLRDPIVKLRSQKIGGAEAGLSSPAVGLLYLYSFLPLPPSRERWASVCVCVCVCVCVLCVCVCVCVHACVHACVCICAHVWVWARACVLMPFCCRSFFCLQWCLGHT